MEDKLTLDEFCATKSETDKRVELLAGFHSWAKNRLKMSKASLAEFETEFRKYTVKPA